MGQAGVAAPPSNRTPRPVSADLLALRDGFISSGGGKVIGGQSRKIEPGDVVIIPPNTPHRFAEIASDQIVYLVVRVDPHKVLPAGYGGK